MYVINLYLFRSAFVHIVEIIENYNPLIDLWHSAERVESYHGYLPINVTVGFEERPFISYNTLEGIDIISLIFRVYDLYDSYYNCAIYLSLVLLYKSNDISEKKMLLIDHSLSIEKFVYFNIFKILTIL